jgi:hypothetical protein
MNLYDVTNGNYRVLRILSYPEHPESLLVLNVRVKADNDVEWRTKIDIAGMYDGPTDIIACQDYQIKWVMAGKKLLESGSAILETSAGKPVRQVWSSIITPTKRGSKASRVFDKFPTEGELINASISSFKIDGNGMSYEWEGTVKKTSERSVE